MDMYHEGHASVFLINLGNSPLKGGVSVTIYQVVGPMKRVYSMMNYLYRLCYMILDREFAKD